MASRTSEDRALAILKYQFSTFAIPPSLYNSSFSMADDPRLWSDLLGNNGILGQSMQDNFANQENGAANLLVAIMWSSALEDENKFFWREVRQMACMMLFRMEGAPAQYLVWVQGVNRSDSRLQTAGITLSYGAAFFTISREEKVVWLPYADGIASSRRVIGELPPFQLRFI
ncbi:uncharacterized protein LY89DRAFT_742371 [Mollisia scopiformis]|uniref:Uncharacterized protein n=1 Tax=Mollisia scopiformis TaxID=149040 RepID=A0A132B8T4_MOLSC|nr:uncharacterized protein LY89DRAFT_742371 [Mollisia scopiformis]KUJ08077.1 hypothetical protein LY89DRAFT_742371 [Mollisia scopiformis]